jgi:hypothetical protein
MYINKKNEQTLAAWTDGDDAGLLIFTTPALLPLVHFGLCGGYASAGESMYIAI